MAGNGLKKFGKEPDIKIRNNCTGARNGAWESSWAFFLCKKVGNCETGLAFDVQRRQTPDFLGDEQEKVDGDIGKVGMEGKQTEKRAHE